MDTQTSHPSSSQQLILLLLATMLSACASGQLGSDLGTKVLAQGTRVSLQWKESHPYDAQLVNSNVSLHAEYINASDQQPVHQLITTSIKSADRERLFELPQHLAAAPTGDVCLFFRYGRNVLPIRPADGLHDTSRFEYEAWSNLARRNTNRKATERAVTEIQASLAQIAPREQAINADFDRRYAGISSVEKCENLAVSRAAGKFVQQKPDDVVAVEDMADEAQKVCVYRVEYAHFQSSHNPEQTRGNVFFLPLLLGDKTVADSVIPNLSRKSQQSLPMIERSLRRHRGVLRSGYKPVLGAWINQMIKLPGAAKANSAAAQREFLDDGKLSNPGSAQTVALFSAEIEAFRGCVLESINQLELREQAWQQSKKDLPARRAAYIEHERGFCDRAVRAKERGLTELSEQRDYLEAELIRVGQMADSAGDDSKPLPGKPQKLNANTCTLGL